MALAVVANFVPGIGQVASYWLMAAAVAVSVVDANIDARKARRQALRDYNETLEDRMEMVDVTPDQARTMVLGRVRAVEGVRRRWVSGDNSETLTMVVSFAGHEIDGFEQFYFEDVPIALNGQGYVLTQPYFVASTKDRVASGQLDASGNGALVLGAGVVAGSVSAMWGQGTGDSQSTGPLAVASFDASTGAVNVSGGPPEALFSVTWQEGVNTSAARVRYRTGPQFQNIGAEMAVDYPGKLTGADRFEGMAVAVVDLFYDPDIYTQGRPNITAVMRGARVYDPRLDGTRGGTGPQRADDSSTWTFSENPALHALHFARHVQGFGMSLAELRLSDFVRAADVCDVPTVFTLRKTDGSTTTVTLPRYRCGIVIKAEGSRREPWEQIMKTMAGRWGWAGGTLRMRAGAVSGPKVFELQPSWIAQRLDEGGEPDGSAVVRITNGVTREQRINRVTGRCVNPDERYQALPYPAVQDAVAIAQDGGTYPLEEDYDGVNHPAHAQHLGTVAIRQTQAALRMQTSCNLSAYRLELFDYGGVTLPRFGMTSKGVEVTGWRWHPAEGVALTLAEIEPAMFEPVEELRGVDPAPNSALPPPWFVAPVTGVVVTSGTVPLVDGSMLTRTQVSWDAVAQVGVRAGGSIEVQYAELGSLPPDGEDWASWPEQGGATSATIPGLRAGRIYLFRVRAVQGLPRVRGPWTAGVLHQVAAAPKVTLQSIGFKTVRAVAAGLSAVNAGTPPAPSGLYLDGVQHTAAARSYLVVAVRRADGVVTFAQNFDVFGGGFASGNMASALNALGNDSIVVVMLPQAMYRCGASRAVFGSPQFKARAAYALVGIPGCGEGNGAEAYQGATDNDAFSWCDLSFSLAGGVITGVSGSYTPRSLADYLYVGDLNATNGATFGVNISGLAQASNIAPGAATSVIVDADSSVVVDGVTGSPYGSITVINSLVFVPDASGDALVTVSGGGYHIAGALAPGSPDKAYATCRCAFHVNGVRSGPARHLDTYTAVGERRDFAVSASRRFAVAAGVEYTVEFSAQKFEPLSTLSVSTEMRVEIVKR
jgi:hypothetical protein